MLATFEKETPVAHEIHTLIKNRWSPRSFSDQKISKDTILALLEAMRWAPSSMNEQPWAAVVAEKGTKEFGMMASSLMPGNQGWAPNAPVFILIMARTTFAANNAPNHSAQYDVGLAVGNLSLQATAHGLSMHQMGGFDRAIIKSSFEIPDHLQPIVIIALGYRDSEEKLPENLRQRELAPRRRKPVESFASLHLSQGDPAS